MLLRTRPLHLYLVLVGRHLESFSRYDIIMFLPCIIKCSLLGLLALQVHAPLFTSILDARARNIFLMYGEGYYMLEDLQVFKHASDDDVLV
jgi:hypothetical protein